MKVKTKSGFEYELSARPKENLVVLDFTSAKVYVYTDVPDTIEPESLLTLLGHNVDNCQWMFTDELNINVDSFYNY